MRVEELVAFIIKRHNIYLARRAGKPKPWTDDPILQRYRFCNVYRELDTVTQWIANNWREPYAGHPHLWFNMVIARLLNWPETLEELGYTEKWNPASFSDLLNDRASHRGKVFSGAYIVSTNGVNMGKPEYLAEHVLTPLWNARSGISPQLGETLAQWHAGLMRFNGMGSFLTAQVVADMKYVEPLKGAEDWFTFAASGPGSRRGLNRVTGRPVDAPWKETAWHATLGHLQADVNKRLPKSWEKLHAQDLQNCLCEFDKYERTRLGEGRPRSTYPGV